MDSTLADTILSEELYFISWNRRTTTTKNTRNRVHHITSSSIITLRSNGSIGVGIVKLWSFDLRWSAEMKPCFQVMTNHQLIACIWSSSNTLDRAMNRMEDHWAHLILVAITPLMDGQDLTTLYKVNWHLIRNSNVPLHLNDYKWPWLNREIEHFTSCYVSCNQRYGTKSHIVKINNIFGV